MSNTFSGDLRELYCDEDLSPDTAVYIYCPVHVDKRRPSMRVYEDGAKCFTCGAYLSRKALRAKVVADEPWRITAAKLGQTGRSAKPGRPILRPAEIQTLAQVAATLLSGGENDFFARRGIHYPTQRMYQLGHYGLGYTIPVFDGPVDHGGVVVTIKFRRDEYLAGRDYDLTHTPKYWGLRGHNEARVYPWPVQPGEAILLVEGELDALLLREHGVNAYSLTSGAGSWKQIHETTFPAKTRIAVVYDSDAAGEAAAAALPAHLRRMGYEYVDTGSIVPSEYKDVTELWQQNVHEFLQLAWSYQWTSLPTRTSPTQPIQPITR